MLTEKKKTSAMIQRLKKWKKYKGISKEDIEKFATAEEKKRLLEGDDPFEDVHGEADPFDVPIGDPQDPTDNEPRPLEDEQEAGTQKTIPVPESLLDDIFTLIAGDENPEEEDRIMNELAILLGYGSNDLVERDESDI
jgi:hypothetical protein